MLCPSGTPNRVIKHLCRSPWSLVFFLQSSRSLSKFRISSFPSLGSSYSLFLGAKKMYWSHGTSCDPSRPEFLSRKEATTLPSDTCLIRNLLGATCLRAPSHWRPTRTITTSYSRPQRNLGLNLTSRAKLRLQVLRPRLDISPSPLSLLCLVACPSAIMCNLDISLLIGFSRMHSHLSSWPRCIHEPLLLRLYLTSIYWCDRIHWAFNWFTYLINRES
jgi:hypothetical protein